MEPAPDAEPVRILAVDDHELFREGLIRLLSTEPDFAIVGQCGAVAEGLELLARLRVDLVLLDFHLEDGRGSQFLESARRAGYRGKILMLTGRMTGEESLKALQLGASGIFLKHNSPPALIKAMRLVLSGHLWIDPRILQIMAEAVPSQEEQALHTVLTERERRVLRGVCEGLTNRDIGDRVGVSEGTVKATLQHLFQKTGVRTRSQLVRVALERPLGGRPNRAIR
jgi:DNA-binding NarL/FixJ family response regulator